MKKMSKNVLFIVVGVLLAFTIDVAAEAVISSGAVSYSNTTVSAALDELFSAVDINNKIGTTDISSIGDGTITGAIQILNIRVLQKTLLTSNGQSLLEINPNWKVIAVYSTSAICLPFMHNGEWYVNVYDGNLDIAIDKSRVYAIYYYE